MGKTPPYLSAHAPDLSPTHGQRIGILTRHLYPTGNPVLMILGDPWRGIGAWMTSS